VALNGQGGAGVAFLQPFDYYTGFHIMVLRPKKAMSDQEKLWWATCITANRFRFGFGRQANRTLKDLELPDPQKMPSWVQSANLDRYRGANLAAEPGTVALPPTDRWLPFTFDQLFTIKKGQRLTKAEMIPGDTPYVGASDANNGVTARIGQKPIHDAGTISVSYNGSVAEAFYQPEPYWATDDVNVLYPKGDKLSPEMALFLCSLIRLEKYRFNYGRKWHLDRMREAVLKLPVTSRKNPDWELMQRYVRALPYSSQIVLEGTSDPHH
jgi:hypothetical protein